jgi:4-amino-4-deoxy-L-arabinose transferase-like glycosyltransferase
MKRPELWGVVYLITLTIIIYMGSTWNTPLFDDTDSFYAEVAREMCTLHDWITPHANSIRFMEKPPLFYWLISLSYTATGVMNAFTTRLPSVLSIIALVYVTFRIGRLIFGWRTGLLGGLALATSVGVFLPTRVILPEAPLTLFIALLFYSFLRWERSDHKSAPLLWMYAFCGLAVMTKGLIGIVFPVAILFFTFLATGRLREISKLLSFKGVLIFLAITVPWHLLMGMRNEGFFWFYFINEHLLRFLGLRYPMDYGTVPLVPFWLLHMLWLFPWSFYLVTLCRPTHFRRVLAENGRDAALLFSWAITIFLFFSVSSRLEYYTFPALPPLAILAANQCMFYWEKNLRKPGVALSAISFLIGASLVGIAIFLTTGAVDGMLKPTGGHGIYLYHFGPLFDLSPEILHTLRAPLLLAGAGLGIALPLHIFVKGCETKTVAMTVGMIFFFAAAYLGLLNFSPILTTKPIADEIIRHRHERPVIIIDGRYEEMSSLAFYVRQPVLVHNGRSFNLEYGSRYPDAPPIFLDDTGLSRLWNQSKRPIFIVTTRAKQRHLESVIPRNRYRVAEYGDKVLFASRPMDLIYCISPEKGGRDQRIRR